MKPLGRPPGPGGPYNRKKPKSVRAWAVITADEKIDPNRIKLRPLLLARSVGEGERLQRIIISTIP